MAKIIKISVYQIWPSLIDATNNLRTTIIIIWNILFKKKCMLVGWYC